MSCFRLRTQAASPEFREYQQQVLANCQAMAKALQAKGHVIVSGGALDSSDIELGPHPS